MVGKTGSVLYGAVLGLCAGVLVAGILLDWLPDYVRPRMWMIGIGTVLRLTAPWLGMIAGAIIGLKTKRNANLRLGDYRRLQ